MVFEKTNCVICGVEFQKVKHNHKICSNRECKLEHNRIRDREYYKNNPAYQERARRSSAKWRKENPELAVLKTQRWRAKNPEKIKALNSKPRKYVNYKNSSDYNKQYRLKNLKYRRMQDSLRWRAKTHFPLQMIRENYDELKKLIK